MKETKVHKKKMPEITPPANFTVISHVDRRDTVDSLVNALQTPVVPLSSHCYFPESLPLPRKATGGSYASGAPSGGTLGRGSAPRGQTPRTPLTPSLFSSSTSNLHRDTVSSGYGTWNAGAKGKIKRGMLSTAEFLVPKSQAPQVPSPSSPVPSDGRYLSAGARHARSVSASNDDVSLHTLGYVNVKPFGQPYIDPHANYTHAENDGYLKPYTVLKPNVPPHRPTSSSPKGRSSTVHIHQELDVDVIFRPPREVAPPPPRDSHHETDSTTFIAAPDRITIQLARPTDLFGPGPGLGLGLGALGSGSGTIGIDDVVPLPCPGSLDSGVSEPPFPAPAAQPDPAPHKSISPEEVKEYLHKLRDYYSDLKDRDQLDSEGYILRENLLKPAAEQILADLQGMESSKKRPAPAPPVNGAPHAPLGASPAPSEDAITPTASTRPVPKPRTTKPSSSASASSSGAATPVGDAAAAAPPFAAPSAAALPEAAVQLNPATLKLAPAHSQLAKVLPSDDDDDEEMTRL